MLSNIGNVSGFNVDYELQKEICAPYSINIDTLAAYTVHGISSAKNDSCFYFRMKRDEMVQRILMKL